MTCRCGGQNAPKRYRSITTRIVYQCEDCGRINGNVSAREMVAMGSEAVRTLPWAKTVQKRRPNSRRREYERALKSPHWKKLKELVAERSGGLCERKGWGCTGRATELGHLNYDRLGNERPEDVEHCCRACNQQEREERITRHVLGD